MVFLPVSNPLQHSSLVHIDKLSFYYGKQVALKNVSFDILPHTLTAVIGPNGAGKSTLLKLLMKMLSSKEGSIKHHLTMKKIAYLPQQAEVDKSFPVTVYDTVAMGLWHTTGPFKAYPASAHEQILQALEALNLSNYAFSPLNALSGGQLQKVLFARLSLQQADLILLDEPFNSLDQPTVEDLMILIQTWHKSGKTIVAVLHDLDLVRLYFPYCILLARDLIAKGKTEDVMTVDNLSLSYAHARQWQTFARRSSHYVS